MERIGFKVGLKSDLEAQICAPMTISSSLVDLRVRLEKKLMRGFYES